MNKNILTVITAISFASIGMTAELLVGSEDVSITPDQPISLAGQFHQRIARSVESPCMACILALESRESDRESAQAIIIAMDIVYPTARIQREFREYVAPRLPGFDINKLFLTGTHTHTGPTPNQERFDDYADAMQPRDYLQFMYERMAEATVKAWKERKPGGMAWGLGHAVVGHNRRVVYADGRAKMYGDTDKPDFSHLEGWEDHAVDVLCFTDNEGKLVAASLAVPCPAQVVETIHQVSSDYWGHVRENLKAKYGQDLVVLGFCGPGGDQVPRPMLRNAAEKRMEKLRKMSRKQELGRRIARTFNETWEVIRQDIRKDIAFEHCVERFNLPMRRITEKELQKARAQYASFKKRAECDKNKSYAEGRMRWFKRTIDLYKKQQKSDMVNRIEIHVLRLDEVAVATNPFELFQDYAMRIHARSPAQQTVLIQLSSPSDKRHSYLPSARATVGGGYSAVPQSTAVGPEGGQILVDKTLESIALLFDDKQKKQ
ncbi:MAG: hypothetical protein R6V06_03605 [Kiritimatiellia bacterium]